MRPGGRTLGASIVVSMVVLAGCAAGAMAPCPGQSGKDQLCPTRGTAHVVVTGFEEWTFDAPLDTEASARPSLSISFGLIQLAYRDRSKLPTDSFLFVAAKAQAEPQTVGASVLVHGIGYTTLDGCTVTLTSFDQQGIAGSFECIGMTPFGLEGSDRLVDATGTFNASP